MSPVKSSSMREQKSESKRSFNKDNYNQGNVIGFGNPNLSSNY